MNTGIWWEGLREREYLEGLGLVGGIILKWTFKECDLEAGTGLIWFRMGTGNGRLWVWQWTVEFLKVRVVSWLTEDLLASQEGLCFMEIVGELVRTPTHCEMEYLSSFRFLPLQETVCEVTKTRLMPRVANNQECCVSHRAFKELTKRGVKVQPCKTPQMPTVYLPTIDTNNMAHTWNLWRRSIPNVHLWPINYVQ